MYEKNFPNKRYKLTMNFLKKHVSKSSKILDLGVKNPFSELMTKEGFNVVNTNGEDLDKDFECVRKIDYDVITAFEIIEHLVAPYNLLNKIKAKNIIATVPLDIWFSKAYKNPNDSRDCHFHEFEDWQFDWLLNASGWKIIDYEKWTNPTKKIGFRPILRYFTPRYYAVCANRI